MRYASHTNPALLDQGVFCPRCGLEDWGSVLSDRIVAHLDENGHHSHLESLETAPFCQCNWDCRGMDIIRRAFGVSTKRGDRVTVNGMPGIILGCDGWSFRFMPTGALHERYIDPRSAQPLVAE